MATIRVIDKSTGSQISAERIGFTDINDREHYGRKFITMKVPRGEKIEDQNIGILNQDGSVEAQPGFAIEVLNDKK